MSSCQIVWQIEGRCVIYLAPHNQCVQVGMLDTDITPPPPLPLAEVARLCCHEQFHLSTWGAVQNRYLTFPLCRNTEKVRKRQPLPDFLHPAQPSYDNS